METNAVAPVVAPVKPESPTSRSPAQESVAAEPFENALKQELAKPETARVPSEKSEASETDRVPAQPVKGENEKSDRAAAPQAADPLPEWAALLENATVRDAEPAAAVEAAQGKESAEGTLLPDARPTDVSLLPLQPMIVPTTATPFEAKSRPAPEALIAPATGRDARASRAKGADDLQSAAPGSTTDVPVESAVAVFSVDRLAAIETPAPTLQPASTLDGLSAGAIGARWATAQSMQAEAAALSQPATARIDTPFGESGWSDAFQQKIVWLVDRQQQSAELHVNPPHLGPVDVLLSLADDGAQIAFTSPHAAVREAIEASLADLRTALSDKGVTLGETLVSADSRQAREQLAEGRRSAPRGSSGSGEIPAEISRPRAVQRGLVDLFA